MWECAGAACCPSCSPRFWSLSSSAYRWEVQRRDRSARPHLHRATAASGTTLAVVRAGGASLYDDAGQPLLELPAGAPLRVDGRTSDNRWFHGAARDGTAGWASADALVIFGVSNVPVREGFSAPAPKTPPAVTSGATPAGATPAGATSLPATVASGTRGSMCGQDRAPAIPSSARSRPAQR